MRKTVNFTVTAEGRDQGKTFVLTEMSASAAEKWAARALLVLSRSGMDIPENIQEAGLAGIAVLGLRALGRITYAEAEPLLDEMFRCIQIMPDRARPEIVRAPVEEDIEEVATRLKLRAEVLELHTGFSLAAAQSKLISGTAA